MDKLTILYSFFLLVGVFLSAISQVLLKKSALRTYNSRLTEYLNPLVVFAYFLFFTTTIISIFAYRYVPLSFGPILESTGYIYVTIFGVRLFDEKINGRKVVALFLVITGIIVYAIWG